MNVYYFANLVSQVLQLLTDVLHIRGVMEVFEDYSVCPFFL
jgi:hypothetical protein